MGNLNKEVYLSQVKNAMLLHFSRQDINTTLEDLNLIFISGKENGKTEEELCTELGSPKDFVWSLLQDAKHNGFTGHLFAYIVVGFLLCAITIPVLYHPTPILSCVPSLMIPAFIWYIFDGNYLHRIYSAPSIYPQKYISLYGITFLLILTEQIMLLLLNSNTNSMIPFALFLYHFSNISIIAAFVILLIVVVRLFKGYYWESGLLFLLTGTIFSSLVYIDYLKYFDKPNSRNIICSLPYIINFIFSIFYYIYQLKKKGKLLSWTHK